MITAPISDHLPGRLIKAAAATPDKDPDKFGKTDQLPMMVSQCALCPACLRTLTGLGHRLCHQSTGTPMDTRARAGHQYRVDSRAALSQNFRPPTKPAAHAPAPLADANYHGNLHQKWFIWSYYEPRHFGNKAVCELQLKRPLSSHFG